MLIPLARRLRAFGVLACLLGIGALGCQPANESGTIGASVDNVLDDPNAYYGATLTVSGAVGDVISPTMFVIDGGEADEGLLVVSVDSIAPTGDRTSIEPIRREDIVQVTGRLREFSRDDVENDFGLTFGDIETDFEGQPVIIARGASATLSSVIVSPKDGGVVVPPADAEFVTDFGAATTDDADALSGKAARFRNLTVAETIDDRSFWVSVGEDSLLVVLMDGAADETVSAQTPDDDRTWQVYGILRDVPGPAVLVNDWKLSEDQVRKLENHAIYLHGLYAATEE